MKYQHFSKKYIALFRRLNTPAKIQDFLNTIPFNFETDGKETLRAPCSVLRENKAHCFEGALLGAYLLSLHGYAPMIMHLATGRGDQDHVVAVFRDRETKLWGALSKTNHAVLRYRDPIYKTIRELVMSYAHEYFLDNGRKTLRSYSKPLHLNMFEDSWSTDDGDLWGIDEELDRVMHFSIAPSATLKKLRRADAIERQMGKVVEWKK